MRNALSDAGIAPEQIDYVNAHATATEQGDSAESEAVYNLFGDDVPVSSLKGHIGHTMAASGAIEMIATIGMMNNGIIIPTLNLETIDTACGKIRHVVKREEQEITTVIKNNFAFGGVNSSVVLRRYDNE
jgi:3-oxoacyl-[acyl-carrier-protein] synthase II